MPLPTNTAYKTLGQSNPAATTDTALYTVPGSTQAVASFLSVTNLSTTSATFRVWSRIAGAATANAQYLAYDVPIGANDTIFLLQGWSGNAADILMVRASTANIAFTLNGLELS